MLYNFETVFNNDLSSSTIANKVSTFIQASIIAFDNLLAFPTSRKTILLFSLTNPLT